MLLVLQGMDTSGKGGVLRHTVGLVDPQGVRITSFKAPTEEERRHDFLWRIEKGAARSAGYIGVFDRSHYEDVLIARVRALAPRRGDRAPLRRDQRLRGASWSPSGTTIIKCMLHISADEQKRAAARAAGRPDQALEVQPRRHRRARAVARLPRGLRDRPRAHQHRRRAVVRGAVRQEVVPQPRDRPAPPRHPARHGPAVAGRRLRRGRREAAAGSTRSRSSEPRLPHRHRHPLRHPAARGRQPARHRRGRRPRHLRLQVPRRRPGRCGSSSPR